MSLEEYIGLSGPKYIVVASSVHEADDLAKSIAPEPRKFVIDGTEYVAINVEPLTVADLAAYISQQAGVEFEFVKGSGNATLLTHHQVLDLLAQEDSDDVVV